MSAGISMSFWLSLAAVLLACIHSAIGHTPLLLQSDSKGHANQPFLSQAYGPSGPAPAPFAIGVASPSPPRYVAPPPQPPPLPTSWADGVTPAGPLLSSAAMIRGIDELAISQSAMRSARDNSKSAFILRQQLVAQQSLEVAKEPYAKVAAMVPEAKAQVLKVRRYALLASQHRNHLQKVQDEFYQLKKEAAELASKAAAGWISADAEKTAERTTDNATTVLARKGDRIAAAVAAAAEPYHLALLRNQKFCAETYAKAKSAQRSSLKLIAKAKQLALTGQELQASNLGVQAVELHATASGMMIQAEDLRQWGTKLYNQANTACATSAGYSMAEQQAADSAAAGTPVNAPMKLPKRV